jgi:hypothetical protein
MTATNHALTGALIGLVVGNPAVALPAAFASHFICDAIPHYASSIPPEKRLKTNLFRNYLIAEAGLCFLLVVCLTVAQPRHWLLADICAFLAASPDLFWINRYVKTRAGRAWRPNLFSKFAGGIQWFQRPIGAVVEAAWFVAGIALLLPFLLST